MLGRQFAAFCRQKWRSMATSLAVGAVMASIFASPTIENAFELLLTAAVGAVIGLTIWISIAVLMALFRTAIHRLPERNQQAAFGVLFVFAGIVGYFFGALLARLIFGRLIRIDALFHLRGLPYLLITGGLVAVVGLLFRAFELMRDRLAQSIERLKQHEWAEKELELARSIQTRLLPPPSITGNGFAIAARNFPAHFVAGDFYDVVHLDDGSIAVIVADVAGKGMGASLIMASVKAVLPFLGHGSVEEAMGRLNAKLVQELDRREFVALAYARFVPSDGTLQLANAGFPDPYVVRDSTVRTLSVGGIRLPLGVRRDITYETLTTKLQPGDRVVFVSDGIPEAPVESADQPLGYERLVDALRTAGNTQPNEWLDSLLARIRRKVREPLSDDWTALVLEYTAGARIAA